MSDGNGPPFGGPPPPGDPGPPPGYGPAPGYGSPPGYGPAPGYGSPPGYGAPAGGYGASNPYQAPGAQAFDGAGASSPPGAALKWLYIGGHAGYWLFALAGIALTVVLTDGKDDPETTVATMATTLPLLGVLFLLLALVAAAVWLYMAWASVPASMRYTDRGRWVTPGKAVGYLFIPFYNLYWMFVANQGLCEAVDRTLLAQGGMPRAPRAVARAACVVQIIPYCNLLVAPILWAVYMFQVDRARREMVTYRG